MNIEDIKRKLSRFDEDWKASRGCCDMEDFRPELRFLLQELDKVQQDNFQLREERDSYSRVAFKVEQEKQRIQQENERLIVSLQKLANATNDPSRVKWPDV